MKFKNGSFYDDEGNKVPLEFGNKDQLRLIEIVKQFRDEGVVPALIFDEVKNFICGMRLKCPCGSHVSVTWETLEESYESEGTKIKCPGCNFKYQVMANEDNFLYFKIVK